jgi:serine/threonine protein phosphatase 1
MSSRIVIGDVHGCYKTLMALIKKLPPGIPITFAGDLIDRGDYSRDVVKFVMEGGHDCVKGNHEDMMVIHKDTKGGYFEHNGGYRTLQSYMPYPGEFEAHAEWMRTLPVYIEYPDVKREDGRYLVVSHSAIGNYWHHRNRQDRKGMFEQNVMWERGRYADVPEIYNIHGHTPQEMGVKIKSFYANVDTGAVFLRDFSEMYGVLSALQFPEMIVYTQKNVEYETEQEST